MPAVPVGRVRHLLAVVALVAGCSATSHAPQLSPWGACPGEDSEGLECATIQVPYDYAAGSGGALLSDRRRRRRSNGLRGSGSSSARRRIRRLVGTL